MTYERIRLTADTTVYASPSGAGVMDGSNAANAFAGVQAAWDALQRDYDMNGKTAIIQLLDGTYTQGIEGYGPMLGLHKKGGSPVIIRGDPTAAAVNFDTPNVNTFSFDGNAAVILTNMTISASGACPIYATNGAIIEYGSIRFGTASAHVMADSGGRCICTGSCSLVQGAGYHVLANGAGASVGIVPGVVLTLYSGIGFNGAFAFAGRQGRISIPIPAVTITGNCTGTKGYASLLGLVDCANAASGLPGSIECGSNYGGQVY